MKKQKQNDIDEVVQDMMRIEIRQRRNEGENEGYECGSKHQLMFNIWKVEKDWRSLTRHEVQINPATDDTRNKPAVKEQINELGRGTDEGEDPCRDKKETNDTHEESVNKISDASQADTEKWAKGGAQNVGGDTGYSSCSGGNYSTQQ